MMVEVPIAGTSHQTLVARVQDDKTFKGVCLRFVESW